MKHTTKLLTLAATLVAVIGLTGCPGPVNNYSDTHEHIWEETILTEPTCTSVGQKKLVCKVCGEEKIEEIAKKPHTWDNGVISDLSHPCTKLYTCSSCGATKTETHHTFECGGCDKCGAFEFDGKDDYQVILNIYKENVDKNTAKKSTSWDDDKTLVGTLYFSFTENNLVNYEEIEIYEVDESGILTKVVEVNLNTLLHRKTNYNIVEIENGNTARIGIEEIKKSKDNTFNILVE